MNELMYRVLRSPWFLGVAGSIIAFKVWIKITTGRCISDIRLDGKTVVVTGANSGIGLEAAKDFAKRGARVVMVCRNMKKAISAKQKIIRETHNENISIKHVDFSSLESVRRCAKEILKDESKIHILLNNAGIQGFQFSKTEDGLDTILQTNHFGPFLFTNILLERIKESAPARIAVVASDLHKMGKLNFDHPSWSNTTSFNVAYGNTKLCNILMANELSDKLRDTGITVNSLTPGVVHTDILRDAPSPYRISWFWFSKFFMKNAKEGAQTLIYVSVSPDLESVSGKYFKECKMSKPLKEAEDKILARKVWELSEKAVNLQQREKHY